MGRSSHKVYNNNILNFQVSTTILNACTKKSGNLSYAPRIYKCMCVCVCVCVCVWRLIKSSDVCDEIKDVSWLGLSITPTAHLQRGKIPATSVLDMTLNNLMVRLQ